MALNLTLQHGPISLSELEVFSSLRDIKMVFDVGARMQMDISTVPSIVDYLEIHPDAEYHLFEPNPTFFKELEGAVGTLGNVHINNFGLGHLEAALPYDTQSQSFMHKIGEPLPVMRMEKYCVEKEVSRIDFLKIDTEGYDFKVLQGAGELLQHIHYIQFEEWNNHNEFVELLGNLFHIKDIGYRNFLCTNKLWQS